MEFGVLCNPTMASILDPPIALKVAKMQERVCWQHPLLVQHQIDQTRLILEDGGAEDPQFSFLVIGDSGSGPHPDHHPQRHLAEQILPHLVDCRFMLHTGDVVYQVGSSEQYPQNFIRPYREWLVGGDRPNQIAFDGMVFKFPILPVLGNHDYYNLPWLYGALVQLSRPLRRLLGINLNPNIGWHGSGVGDAYARAFLDYLQALPHEALETHINHHYGPWGKTGQGLRYQPGQFTRLPNRYYRFRYGGIDFFALDSSTLNDPTAASSKGVDRVQHQQLLKAHDQRLQHQQQEILAEAAHLAHDRYRQERLDDLQAKLEQLEEIRLDLQKQLNTREKSWIDAEQLTWLRDGLIASWADSNSRGRILFFHHPPYVTESTKWNQGQTLAIRYQLRWVLDQVVAAVPQLGTGQPPVNLVINGHAHCFEHLRSLDTGYGDSHIDWLVCGGSGLSLRRQRPEGPDLEETRTDSPGKARAIAHSECFVGLTGHQQERRRPYSFIRIDVGDGDKPKFRVTPHISERYHQTWRDYPLNPLMLG